MHVEPGFHERDRTFAVIFGGISSLILLITVTTIIHFAGIEDQPARLAPETNQKSEEVVFETPKEISWSGTIISITGGGYGYAVQLIQPETDITDFFAAWPDNSSMILSGRIIVKGRWVGITCAYRYTLFSGKCVPEVEIETIERLELSIPPSSWHSTKYDGVIVSYPPDWKPGKYDTNNKVLLLKNSDWKYAHGGILPNGAVEVTISLDSPQDARTLNEDIVRYQDNFGDVLRYENAVAYRSQENSLYKFHLVYRSDDVEELEQYINIFKVIIQSFKLA